MKFKLEKRCTDVKNANVNKLLLNMQARNCSRINKPNMRSRDFINVDVNKLLRNIRFTEVARQRNQVLTGCASHRRWKHQRKQTLREEGTSALAGFHAGPLSWSNWNLEC